MLERTKVIRSWHDRGIGAGEEWEKAIDHKLQSAHVILLLVSADFVALDYCYDVEMQRALDRHAAGEATVIPVILRQCPWSRTPFAKLQALPKDAKPVTSWANRDEVWTSVANGIEAAVARIAKPSLGELAKLLMMATPVPAPSRTHGTRAVSVSNGASVLKAIRAKLPRHLRLDSAANDADVFVDSDGLQRLMVYEYQNHCNVRVRCSQDWGFRGCGHRATQKNAAGWLHALRVETDDDVDELVSLYMIEWGQVEH